MDRKEELRKTLGLDKEGKVIGPKGGKSRWSTKINRGFWMMLIAFVTYMVWIKFVEPRWGG